MDVSARVVAVVRNANGEKIAEHLLYGLTRDDVNDEIDFFLRKKYGYGKSETITFVDPPKVPRRSVKHVVSQGKRYEFV